MQSTNDLLSARDTARRLGIKLDTLYAYVSRGLLNSVAIPDSRERRYRIEDVERFSLKRGGERVREALMPVIDSAICLIDNGRCYYRGRDAVALSETAGLEEVATLLWRADSTPYSSPHPAPSLTLPRPRGREFTATLPRPRGREGWGQSGERGSAAQEPEGEGGQASASGLAGLIERCQIRLAALAERDVGGLDLSAAGVARTGRLILSTMVGCIDGAGTTGEPVHRRLAKSWRLGAAETALVRRCLVLLADHELNASTFVARCVASTGATPYAVVAAALAALSGRRHGGASARAEALFREIGNSAEPLPVMAARLARGDDLPGIGHPLYPDGDPRARALLAAIEHAAPAAHPRIAAAAAAAGRLTGQHPNVDFALAAVVAALDLPEGAALALFVVGRAAGWIAHAIEQYDSRILIRPRARYTGPRPA